MDIEAIDTIGSYEDTLAVLSDAFDQFVAETIPDELVVGWVEATYPEYMIAGVGDADQVEILKVPYSIGDDDVIAFGDPEDLGIIGVTPDAIIPESELMLVGAEKVLASALAVKGAIHMRRRMLIRQAVGDPEFDGVGGGRISTEGQGGLTSEGAMDGGEQITNPDHVSDVVSAPIAQWLSGVYYLDHVGNLSASPVAANLSERGVKGLEGDDGRKPRRRFAERLRGRPAAPHTSGESPQNLDGSMKAAAAMLTAVREAKMDGAAGGRVAAALAELHAALSDAGLLDETPAAAEGEMSDDVKGLDVLIAQYQNLKHAPI